jgi:hypothetical protein
MNCGIDRRTRRPRIPVILVIILVLFLPIALTALGVTPAGTASILATASVLLSTTCTLATAELAEVKRK